MDDWFNYLNYEPESFVGSGDVGGYNPDVGSYVGPSFNDPETLKLLRQQAIAGSGESPLAGFGGEGVSQNVPLVDVSGGNWLTKLLGGLKTTGGKALDFAQTPQGIMALLAALASRADRARPSGGGTTMAYQGYKPLQRTLTPSQTPGAPGPIARYAAEGGLMRAYARGGTVQMEDGGFVMTKKAVDGAGGPQGIAHLVPGARMIGGPPDPTGKRDLTPAVINGPHGQTPAKVSRGEAYVPKAAVDSNGGSKALYALMNSLQRRA